MRLTWRALREPRTTNNTMPMTTTTAAIAIPAIAAGEILCAEVTVPMSEIVPVNSGELSNVTGSSRPPISIPNPKKLPDNAVFSCF
jgi:hypothetical protein